MKIKRFIPLILIVISVYGASYAVDGIHSQNPVKQFIDFGSPIEFANRFKGDTIYFNVPYAEDRYFESFYLVNPDTIWIKDRPKKKLPEREKHFRLRTNYRGKSGWGVNSYRFYTPGTSLENKRFVVRGTLEEHIEYLGVFRYILLEDVLSGKMIKWNYEKDENSGLTIFSPSISRRLNRLCGRIMDIEVDSVAVACRCKDVSYSIDVKRMKWEPKLYFTFKTETGYINSKNWSPKFFLRQ